MDEKVANENVDGLPVYDDFPRFHWGMRTIDDRPLWGFEYHPENCFSTASDEGRLRKIEALGGCEVSVSDVAVDGKRCKCFHVACRNPHDIVMPEIEWSRLQDDYGWSLDDPYFILRIGDWQTSHRCRKERS